MAARVGPIHNSIEILRQGIPALDHMNGDVDAEPAYPSGSSMSAQFRVAPSSLAHRQLTI
jgi:hypothetical protein